MKRALLATLIPILLALATLASGASQQAAAQTIAGTIAYVRPNDATGDEIRLIQPDGSNDRRIWSVGQPDPNHFFEITDLDWKPDASEIAFSSDHGVACSIFDSDIYAVRPDGSGYGRVTNAPICADLARYPKGSVTVTVHNNNSATGGAFIVYVQGASEVQEIVVPLGSSDTVTFNDVADFGDTYQRAVVIEGLERWSAPLAQADVKPGQTVHAGTLDVTGAGKEQHGGYLPSWHSDGSRLGFIYGGCGDMQQIMARPPAGALGTPLLQVEHLGACLMDWGPTPALASQLLYSYSHLPGGGIYRVSEGSANRGTRLVAFEDHERGIDLQWLPDGSGFVFTKAGDFLSNGNIYTYDFATSTVTQLTDFTDEFVLDVSVSPDGQFIVFERAPTLSGLTGDLWVMRRDGSDMRLLVGNGIRPSWSQRAPQLAPNVKIYLPAIVR